MWKIWVESCAFVEHFIYDQMLALSSVIAFECVPGAEQTCANGKHLKYWKDCGTANNIIGPHKCIHTWSTHAFYVITKFMAKTLMGFLCSTITNFPRVFCAFLCSCSFDTAVYAGIAILSMGWSAVDGVVRELAKSKTIRHNVRVRVPHKRFASQFYEADFWWSTGVANSGVNSQLAKP